jgi:DNA-directed RNA polymerase specialized sigma24 family protein
MSRRRRDVQDGEGRVEPGWMPPLKDAASRDAEAARARRRLALAASEAPVPATAGRSAPAEERLLDAMAAELSTLYRLTGFLGEQEVDPDEALEWLAIVALQSGRARRPVAPGRERAFILRTLLALLGADAGDARRRREALPDLETSSPMPSRSLGISTADFARLDGALRTLDKRTRASVLLVLHEGLSLEEATRVQGGSRRAFARRYAEGISSLDADLIDVLIGPSASSPLS